MRKLMSKVLILAMIFVMMVPMSVSAASKTSGGKLVKSVTEYGLNDAGTGWIAQEKTMYTYDKKNNPTEIKTLDYDGYLLGVPVSAEVSLTTVKNKYKGGSLKSATFYNEAGTQTGKDIYKKGKIASWNGAFSTSNQQGTEFNNSSRVGLVTWGKNGFVASAISTNAWNAVENGAVTDSSVSTTTTTYSWTQKKGVPSIVYATSVSADDPSDSWTNYSFFNAKGLRTENGYFTSDGAAHKSTLITYTMKKGVVKEAVVWRVDDEATGKVSPIRRYVFEYNKTKVSKTRYFNMINVLVGYGTGFFSW